MLRHCFILLAICCFHFAGFSQLHSIKGILKDSSTHFAVRGAKISNTAKNKNVYSDQRGFFSIEAAPDDIILVTVDGYDSKRVTYSRFIKDTIVIYLTSRSKMLPTVSITSRYNQYQVDSMERKRAFEQMRGGRLTRVSRADGFGITFNLDRLWKKRYKYQRRNEKLFRQREKQAYVAYRYSPELVAYYTRLKGQELQDFLNKHTPSYEWLRSHPGDEEVFYYINNQLKLFRSLSK